LRFAAADGCGGSGFHFESLTRTPASKAAVASNLLAHPELAVAVPRGMAGTRARLLDAAQQNPSYVVRTYFPYRGNSF
jgi:hypothetical protein